MDSNLRPPWTRTRRSSQAEPRLGRNQALAVAIGWGLDGMTITDPSLGPNCSHAHRRRHDKIGDGKISIFCAAEAIRIRNDDRGEAAL